MIEFTLAWEFQFVYLGEMDSENRAQFSSTPRRLAESSGKIPQSFKGMWYITKATTKYQS